MRKIKWTSKEDRTIPKYGAVSEGSEIDLPAPLAKSFVDQGLAKYVTATSKNRNTQEAE